MSEVTTLFEYLAAGGDVATLGLVYFLWRLERRVFKIELTIGKDKK